MRRGLTIFINGQMLLLAKGRLREDAIPSRAAAMWWPAERSNGCLMLSAGFDFRRRDTRYPDSHQVFEMKRKWRTRRDSNP